MLFSSVLCFAIFPYSDAVRSSTIDDLTADRNSAIVAYINHVLNQPSGVQDMLDKEGRIAEQLKPFIFISSAPLSSTSSDSESAPTSLPTLGPGWLYVNDYASNDDCTGDVISSTGVPTNTCITLYGSNGEAVSSLQYYCTNGMV